MKPFTFEKAKSLKEALRMKTGTGRFIAGGTNIIDLMKKGISDPDVLVDVTTALSSGIEMVKNNLIIGAMTKNTALSTDRNILAKFPLVAKAVLAGASPQIRNMASTAGNLLQRTRCPYFYDISTPCNKRKPGSGCSALQGDQKMSAVVGYSSHCVAVHPSDLCISLAALDAEVHTADAKQQKTSVPFKDFHKLPGETPWKDNYLPENSVITHISLPANLFHTHYAYVKLRERTSYAFALVSAAAALELNGDKIKDARLASGGVAHKPWRWYEAEDYLRGKKAKDDVFRKAAEIAVQGVKPLSHNKFKVPMLRAAVEEALQKSLRA